MLKDRLVDLNAGSGLRCKMPQVFEQLDSETKEALRETLKSNTASVRGLQTALCEEGYQVSRESVDHSRRVLRGEHQCVCLDFLNGGGE
jgi:hypothetical protein